MHRRSDILNKVQGIIGMQGARGGANGFARMGHDKKMLWLVLELYAQKGPIKQVIIHQKMRDPVSGGGGGEVGGKHVMSQVTCHQIRRRGFIDGWSPCEMVLALIQEELP